MYCEVENENNDKMIPKHHSYLQIMLSSNKSVNFQFLQPDQVNNFGICDLKVFELYS